MNHESAPREVAHDARRRRRVGRWHLALSLCLVAAMASAFLFLVESVRSGGLPVAHVVKLEGEAQSRGDSGAARAQALGGPGTQIVAGERVETLPGSRLVLQRPGGLTLHVSASSRFHWQTADALRLEHGVVYVETGEAGTEDALAIVTPGGRVRHLGTRYSVQVEDEAVSVMVREGAVAIEDGRSSQRVDRGYSARIGSDGRLTASTLAPTEGPWRWLAVEAPRFEVEGRSLHAVLDELAQASGLPLRYASADIEAASRGLLLHGPELELPPEQAIDVVLLTTGFSRSPPLQIVHRDP